MKPAETRRRVRARHTSKTEVANFHAVTRHREINIIMNNDDDMKIARDALPVVAETISAGGTTDSSTIRSADASRNRARTAGPSSADDMVTVTLRIILSSRPPSAVCLSRALLESPSSGVCRVHAVIALGHDPSDAENGRETRTVLSSTQLLTIRSPAHEVCRNHTGRVAG